MPSIDIGANTREAQRQVKDLGESLDGVAGSLDDLARESATTEAAADKLGRSLDDVGRDGEKAGDKLERTFRDMVRDAGKADAAIEKVGTNGKAGFDKVRDGAQEVTQEVGQNLGEAVSSIRGDISDLGQVGQDTLGGLAASLAGAGPAGIAGAAALAAGAVGLGMITAELQKQQEEADALRDRIVGAYQAAAQEGRTYIDTAALISEANDVMFNPERAEEWKRLQEEATKLGMDNADIIAANAGDLDAQAQVQERINALIDEQNKKPRQNGVMGTAEWDKENRALGELRDRWERIGGVTEDNAQKARDLQAVTDRLHTQERAQIDRTKNASQARYEAMAQQYARMKAAVSGDVITPTIKPRIDLTDWKNLRLDPKTAALVVKVTGKPVATWD